MARLLAAEREAARQHLLHHVLVADGAAHHADARARAARSRGRCCSSRWRRWRRRVSRPSRCSWRAHISSTASPSTTRPRSSTKIARSPSPSNATPRSAARLARRSRRASPDASTRTRRLMLRPSGSSPMTIGVEAEARETAPAPTGVVAPLAQSIASVKPAGGRDAAAARRAGGRGTAPTQIRAAHLGAGARRAPATTAVGHDRLDLRARRARRTSRRVRRTP